MKKTPLFHSASPVRLLSVTAVWTSFAVMSGFSCQTALAETSVCDTATAISAKAGHAVVSDWQNRTPFAANAVQTVQTTPASGAASRKTARRKASRKAGPAVMHAAMQTSGKSHVPPHIYRDVTATVQTGENQTPSALSANATETPENIAGYATPMENGYTIGPARISVNYEKANDKSRERTSQLLNGKATYDIADNDLVETPSDRDNWHFGMEYDTGNGRFNAAMNLVRIRDLKNGGPSGDNDDSADLKTFTIGYTYDASDTTSFYGMVAHTDYDSDALHGYRHNDTENDSITGFQVGMTHRF